MTTFPSPSLGPHIGRYVVHEAIASGGMGTVHLGRAVGPRGFQRVVAIKRMHAHLAAETSAVEAFYQEALLAARVRHPNVVSTLDVVHHDGHLFLVLEYVAGVSLGQIAKEAKRRGTNLPPAIVSGILCGVLHGLHAAHEAVDEEGRPLRMIHRDVSPQNILVGTDGAGRLLDFGIAKASVRAPSVPATLSGCVKGKRGYFSPEQRLGLPLDRRSDVFTAGVVLWESLTGRRLIDEEGPLLVSLPLPRPPSSLVEGLPEGLDDVVLRALKPAPKDRFATARALAIALETACPPATPWQVSDWLQGWMAPELAEVARRVARMESEVPAPLAPPAANLSRDAVTVAQRVAITTLAATTVATSTGDGLAEGEAPSPRDIPGLVPARRLATRGVVATVLAAVMALSAAALVRVGRPVTEAAVRQGAPRALAARPEVQGPGLRHRVARPHPTRVATLIFPPLPSPAAAGPAVVEPPVVEPEARQEPPPAAGSAPTEEQPREDRTAYAAPPP